MLHWIVLNEREWSDRSSAHATIATTHSHHNHHRRHNHSFIRSFIHSSICSFVRPFVRIVAFCFYCNHFYNQRQRGVSFWITFSILRHRPTAIELNFCRLFSINHFKVHVKCKLKWLSTIKTKRQNWFSVRFEMSRARQIPFSFSFGEFYAGFEAKGTHISCHPFLVLSNSIDSVEIRLILSPSKCWFCWREFMVLVFCFVCFHFERLNSSNAISWNCWHKRNSIMSRMVTSSFVSSSSKFGQKPRKKSE